MNVDMFPGYGTFSGTDMTVSFIFPDCKPITIGTATTVTYSSLRDKGEVRTLGRISVKGYTKGGRRVAGQLIFTVIDKHVVERIKDEVAYLKNIPKLLLDELPPFDIMVTTGNEYGHAAFLIIYGATIVHEGKVMSIEDMLTENTVMYLARDIRPLGSQFGGVDLTPLTEFRGLDEALGKFKVEDLAPEVAMAQWEETLQQIQEEAEETYNDTIDEQTDDNFTPHPHPYTPPTSVTPPDVPPAEEYTLQDVTLKVKVLAEDGIGLEAGRVRIFVPYQSKCYPPVPDFYTAGDDHMVIYNLERVPIYHNPASYKNKDLVNIRARATGHSDATKEIHLSEYVHEGVAVVAMSLRYATGSFRVEKVRPTGGTINGDMTYRTIHCIRLFHGASKAPGEKVTWRWKVDDIEHTVYPNHITDWHDKDDTTGSDGVSTFDIIAEIKKLYPQFDLTNGVSIKLNCMPVRGGLPCGWVIKSQPIGGS